MVITKKQVIQRTIYLQNHANYARTITILRLELTAQVFIFLFPQSVNDIVFRYNVEATRLIFCEYGAIFLIDKRA